jgi:hypothetical protein
MFRVLILLIFIAIAGWKIWLFKNNRIDKKVFLSGFQSFLTLIRFKDADKLRALRVISYQLTFASFLLLALTAYLPVLLFGGHLSGFPLILHVTVAPVFCVFLALSAVLWAHSQRLFSSDWLQIKSETSKKIFALRGGIASWQKVYFWLFLVFSVPAILSIVLSMYPLFGTEGQSNLIIIHSWSTLLLFIIGIMHTLGVAAIVEENDK